MFNVDHQRPLVMGILNVTPDSFSDGGQLLTDSGPDFGKILFRAEQLIGQGADLLDIGGESTRPGAQALEPAVELERVVPVIAAIKARFAIPLSVDTSTPEVMEASAREGVDMINDVRALRRPGALAAAAKIKLPVTLMHMQGEPTTMQREPTYGDVVAEVGDFLAQRVTTCIESGLARDNIVIDPGFGFGKNLAHNLALFRALPRFCGMGLPVMVGLSRKRMVGAITGRQTDARVHGSVALALLAAQKGASIIRVHDVGATVDALKILAATELDAKIHSQGLAAT